MDSMNKYGRIKQVLEAANKDPQTVWQLDQTIAHAMALADGLSEEEAAALVADLVIEHARQPRR